MGGCRLDRKGESHEQKFSAISERFGFSQLPVAPVTPELL
jgi:hypothetical protein